MTAPPPLSEGLDLPLWVHIFASTVVSPYDQPIYTATSFEPNVNHKKQFVLLF